MQGRRDDLLRSCLARLREIPFVVRARLVAGRGTADTPWDESIELVTHESRVEIGVVAKRTHLTREIVDGVLVRVGRSRKKAWILFAPHVGRPLARYLGEHDVNFVDPAGNHRLHLDHRHVATAEGRPPAKRPALRRGIGAAGHQVLFALLVRPDLLQAPVRSLAAAAGVAPATAAARLVRLEAEGLIVRGRSQGRIIEPRRLLDSWLHGYPTLVRPRLLLGRYRAREADPMVLERRLEVSLGTNLTWGFGGGAAAYRLTGYYRGEETTLHLGVGDVEVARRLRAQRADDGPLIVMRAPGPVAFEGAKPRTVAPLLVYTELLCAGDKRALQAAALVQRSFMADLQ